MENLTAQEKAALYFQVVEGVNDWKVIYSIAIGAERYNSFKDSTKNVNASIWKKSERIRKAHEEIKRKFHYLTEEIKRTAIEEERKRANSEGANGANDPRFNEDVNFLDLENFLTEANKQANKIKDDKERRAWLELIGKYMSFKDRNESETTEIKRFYTPIECQKCDIYNKCKSCTLSECPQLL